MRVETSIEFPISIEMSMDMECTGILRFDPPEQFGSVSVCLFVPCTEIFNETPTKLQLLCRLGSKTISLNGKCRDTQGDNFSSVEEKCPVRRAGKASLGRTSGKSGCPPEGSSERLKAKLTIEMFQMRHFSSKNCIKSASAMFSVSLKKKKW